MACFLILLTTNNEDWLDHNPSPSAIHSEATLQTAHLTLAYFTGLIMGLLSNLEDFKDDLVEKTGEKLAEFVSILLYLNSSWATLFSTDLVLS